MAKEQFQRTKPHVNVASQRLRQAGMTSLGVEQLLKGQPISSPSDRALVAQIVASAMEDNRSFWLRVGQLNSSGSM